jgi:hypothetical protein
MHEDAELEMYEAVPDIEAELYEAAAGVETHMVEGIVDEATTGAGADMGAALAQARAQPGAHVNAEPSSMTELEDKGFWGLSSPTCPPTPESAEAGMSAGGLSHAVPEARDTMVQETYSSIQHASTRRRSEQHGRSESHRDRRLHQDETRASSQHARSSISPKLLHLENELLAWRRSHSKLGAKTRRAGESLTEIGGKLLEALEYASASLADTAVSTLPQPTKSNCTQIKLV